VLSLRNLANKKPCLRYLSRVYELRFVSSATVLLQLRGWFDSGFLVVYISSRNLQIIAVTDLTMFKS